MFKQIHISIISLSFISLSSAFAWEGTDQNTGNKIEIEKGNSVEDGKEIEIYDHDEDIHKTIEISGVNRFGNTVEIEGTDIETGEEHILEMDD